jgi:hypothetical protein
MSNSCKQTPTLSSTAETLKNIGWVKNNPLWWSNLKPFVVGLLLLLLGIYAFFALSARNEIYYLCGNFKSGVSYSSVLRQLDTANLSNYKIEKSEQGKQVTHSSAIHLNLVRCEITFTEDEKVSHAIYNMR